ERQMVRRQRRGFSGGRFQIFLRRCYPISKSCLGLDNEKMRKRYVTDIMERPALRGYPQLHSKGGPHAWGAFDLNHPLVGEDDLPCNGQAQPMPCRVVRDVRRGKSLEYPG